VTVAEANSRSAELYGSSVVGIDKFLRTLGWHRLAEQEYQSADADTRARIVKTQGPQGPMLIAKAIETMDTFEHAVKEGYVYFQGFFFGRPLITLGREVPGQQVANLRLMRALYDPELTVHQLEELIKHDASLCYRILRTVNSATYMLQQPVQSIRQALVLLGRDTVRRWASLWALAGLSEKAHSELVIMSTVRGRCCELLAGRMGGEEAAGEGFLAGMCSLLDAILERPMKDVLRDLPLDPETQAALLGEDNKTRRLLDCVIAYENGQWDRCVQLAKSFGVRVGAHPGLTDAQGFGRTADASSRGNCVAEGSDDDVCAEPGSGRGRHGRVDRGPARSRARADRRTGAPHVERRRPRCDDSRRQDAGRHVVPAMRGRHQP